MAQLVEHNLAKVGVAGSSPVVRSIVCKEPIEESALFIRRLGQVVRQGLQSLYPRFESGSRLHMI